MVSRSQLRRIHVQMDDRMKALMALVGNGIGCEDKRLDEYEDDRGIGPDTINLCINAGILKQVGNSDLDDFSLLPVTK